MQCWLVLQTETTVNNEQLRMDNGQLSLLPGHLPARFGLTVALFGIKFTQ